MTNIAGREVSTLDTILIGTGILAFIDLFLPWYRFDLGIVTVSANAFDFFLAWFGTLLLVAVGALAAARIFAGFTLPISSKAGPALIMLAIAALGLLCVVLRFLADNDYTFIGLYLAIVLGAVQVFVLFTAFKASGEKLPDFGNKGQNNTQPPPHV